MSGPAVRQSKSVFLIFLVCTVLQSVFHHWTKPIDQFIQIRRVLNDMKLGTLCVHERYKQPEHFSLGPTPSSRNRKGREAQLLLSSGIKRLLLWLWNEEIAVNQTAWQPTLEICRVSSHHATQHEKKCDVWWTKNGSQWNRPKCSELFQPWHTRK